MDVLLVAKRIPESLSQAGLASSDVSMAIEIREQTSSVRESAKTMVRSQPSVALGGDFAFCSLGIFPQT